MKRTATALIALLLVFASAPARAFVPQTITVDGVNDFDPSNLLKDDRNDTQPNCSPQALPLDLGRVYVTNDANYLYLGIEFAQTCFCNMNLGMAFDVGNTPNGGTSDPFGRDIGWTAETYRPDFMIYDVTPTSCNTFNYEVLYKDTTVAAVHSWQNISTRLNPLWGSGANGLGIVDSLNFKELKIPLTLLGLTAGTPLNIEMWVTQEGSTKGPLDALASDDVQMSHSSSTTFDTTAVVQMTHMLPYVVQSAVDTVPPTLASAVASGFAVLANKQFGLTSNKVDLTFSEPLDLTTAQTAGNYAFAGPLTRTVTSAVRDGASANVVHLTLSSGILANAASYQVTVTGVKDVAGNVIRNSGTGNVAGFFIQNVTFNGDFHLALCNGTFLPTDSLTIEGSQTPLTITPLCDNALMTDANSDSIYNITVPFCLLRDPVTLKNQPDSLDWKFAAKCNTYEPLAGNRRYGFSSDNGANVTINAVWNNDTPAAHLSHPVDVIFTVDASGIPGLQPSDVITLMGNVAPLAFTQPGVAMHDDGLNGDAVAGDHIYSARVHFPSCAAKSLDWKVDYQGAFECLGQGNRHVYISDTLYSASSPLTIPARRFNRCTVTDKAIPVTFKIDSRLMTPLPAPSDTFAVLGSVSPLAWDAPPATSLWAKDDGVSPDFRANDGVYTKTITFPDSSATYVEYKFWHDGNLECFGVPNRNFVLDDQVNSIASPIVRQIERWDYCTDYAGVAPLPALPAGQSFAVLHPVMPNPTAHHAAFSFELYRTGHVTFSIYDVTGLRVARLVDAAMPAGVHSVTWDGLSDSGLQLASGVYMYELAMGNNRLSHRMILVH